ncbi:MAG: hypothetical protein WDZ51_06155 [Pirellulaceae bacterium]
MSIEEAIYKRVKDNASIDDIVDGRIFPHHIPQSNNDYPLITYQLISNVHDHHLGGASGITVARIQFDCWGLSMAHAVGVAEKVRNLLQGFMGDLNNIKIHFISLIDERSFSEAPVDASDIWLFRKSVDYQIKYQEPLPDSLT